MLPGGVSVVEWLVGSWCRERKRRLEEKRRTMEEQLDEIEATDSLAMSLAEQLGEWRRRSHAQFSWHFRPWFDRCEVIALMPQWASK